MPGPNKAAPAESIEESYPLSPLQEGMMFDGFSARHSGVPESFEAQVARTPDAVALVYGKEEVSYRELDNQANRVSHHLRSLLVAPDVPVGNGMHRSAARYPFSGVRPSSAAATRARPSVSDSSPASCAKFFTDSNAGPPGILKADAELLMCR